MLTLDAPAWFLEVNRGPDWVFVRVNGQPHEAAPGPMLAESIWSVLQQHFTYRLVLELDAVEWFNSHLVGQLVLLHKRLHCQGGLLRLCGLTADNQRVLEIVRLGGQLPNYATRADAVMGHRPTQPR